MKFLLSFAHPHVNPNLYEFLFKKKKKKIPETLRFKSFVFHRNQSSQPGLKQHESE